MDGFVGNVIKYLLFATNFLILFMGCLCLGFGIYVLAAGKDLAELIKDGQGEAISLYSSAAIILIVLSLFVIVVTFFGCCGALKESKCMLGTYFAIVLAFFIIFIVAAILAYTQSEDKMKEPLKKSLKSYQMPNKTRIKDAWDYVQEGFKCCGHEKWEDWEDDKIVGSLTTLKALDTFSIGTTNGEKVPKSCCKQPKGTELKEEDVTKCQKDPAHADYDLKGCFTKLKDSVRDHKSKILGVAITILVVMFLNMMFAFALCTMAKK